MCTSLKSGRRKSVPKIVEPDPWHIRVGDQPHELLRECVWMDRCAVFTAEDEIDLLPGGTGLEPITKLRSLVFSEYRAGIAVDNH